MTTRTFVIFLLGFKSDTFATKLDDFKFFDSRVECLFGALVCFGAS